MLETLKNKIKEQALSQTKLLIFNSVFGISIIAVGVLIIIEAIMHYEVKGLITISILFVYLIVIFVATNIYTDKVNFFTALILYPLNMIFFPYLFLYGEGGGITSAMPMWFLFGIMMNIILVEGMHRYVLLILSIAMDVATILVSYYHPEITNYIDDSFYFYEDNIICLICVAASIGIIFQYLRYIENIHKEEIKQNSVKLHEEKNNAIKANRAKTTFLANISRDMRVPLTDILAATSIGMDCVEDKEKMLEYLKLINERSMKLLYLFDNTLDMAEIESGALIKRESKFLLSDLTKYIEAIGNKNSVSYRINFNLKNEDGVDEFFIGDINKLRQIILLVLDNAFKYTMAEGKVSFTTKVMDDGNTDNLWCRFEIKDTGIGMSYDFIENGLFEPYTRGTDDFVMNVQGSGVGMCIVKNLLATIKGKIKIQSKEKTGTSVTIDVPLRRASNEAKQEKSAKNLKLKNCDILIVDDNKLAIEITKKLLEQIGAYVTVCNNSDECIRLLTESEENKYKMIIMDTILPGMDGYSTTRYIRSLEREDIANIPIMAATANAFSIAEEKASLSGMNEYITKPIDVTEFYQKIYRYLVKYSV